MSAFGTAANQFGAFVGDVPMSQITRKIVIRFRDKLKNEDGLNYKTIETKMALLSAMFQIAVDAEILESNPASRIKVAKPKNPPVSRLPYNIKNLQSIFAAPIFSGCNLTLSHGRSIMQTPFEVLNIGADVAKAEIVVACSEGSFSVRKIANKRAAVTAFLRDLPAGSRIGLESTGIYHELLPVNLR